MVQHQFKLFTRSSLLSTCTTCWPFCMNLIWLKKRISVNSFKNYTLSSTNSTNTWLGLRLVWRHKSITRYDTISLKIVTSSTYNSIYLNRSSLWRYAMISWHYTISANSKLLNLLGQWFIKWTFYPHPMSINHFMYLKKVNDSTLLRPISRP